MADVTTSMMQPMLDLINEQIQYRKDNPPPTQAQRQGALDAYTNAIKTAGADTRKPWEVMIQSSLLARDPSNPYQASRAMWQGLTDWQNTQREAQAKREMLAAKTAYDDILARQKDALTGGLGQGSMTEMMRATLNPIQNVGGVGIDRLTGRVIVPKFLGTDHAKVRQDALKYAIEQKMPEPEAYADAQADNWVFKILSNPSIAGSLYAQRPGQTPLPSQTEVGSPFGATPGITPPEARESYVDTAPKARFDLAGLDPQTRRVVEAVVMRYKANPNPGTKQAMEQVLALVLGSAPEAAVPTGAAPAATSLQYRDEAAAKQREATMVNSAKSYEDLFIENVAKPAAAFSDTGRIMMEFNRLGQMQTALKNGKLKEYMAGEPGKWILSFADPKSDLAKGIANAQEAEKLSAGMVQQILQAAKGVQTEGDAQRAYSQVPNLGASEDANKYIEAYINETARQLKLREQIGNQHAKKTGTYEGYDSAWRASPIMTEAKGSVKKLGAQWIGLTQYIEKFKAKNPSATDSDAIAYWNQIK